jgi:hypothetical protein
LDVPAFFTGAFFCFFALGGVLDRSESLPKESRSDPEPSSSLVGFARFFDADFVVFRVDWTSFFAPAPAFGAFGAFAVGAFLAAVFAFGF